MGALDLLIGVCPQLDYCCLRNPRAAVYGRLRMCLGSQGCPYMLPMVILEERDSQSMVLNSLLNVYFGIWMHTNF